MDWHATINSIIIAITCVATCYFGITNNKARREEKARRSQEKIDNAHFYVLKLLKSKGEELRYGALSSPFSTRESAENARMKFSQNGYCHLSLSCVLSFGEVFERNLNRKINYFWFVENPNNPNL